LKIENICTLELIGKPPSKGFWEERLVRPVDIYEKFRGVGPEVLGYTE
jgi:hypothetical protein